MYSNRIHNTLKTDKLALNQFFFHKKSRKKAQAKELKLENFFERRKKLFFFLSALKINILFQYSANRYIQTKRVLFPKINLLAPDIELLLIALQSSAPS